MKFELNFTMNETILNNQIALGDTIKVTLYYDYVEYLIKNQDFINESTKNVFQYIQSLIFQVCFILIALNLFKLSFFLFKCDEKENTKHIVELDSYYDLKNKRNKKKIASFLIIIGIFIIIFSWYIFQI
jgi:hypothetical protein